MAGLASGSPRPARLGRGITLFTLLLAAVFCGVGWLQWRSLALLNATVQYQGDNLVWNFYQVESEYLQLQAMVRSLAYEPSPEAIEALQGRYEVFVSRISLIEPERTETLLTVPLPLQKGVLQAMHAFVDEADTLIGPDTRPPTSAGFWHRLADRMAPLQPQIHELALEANRSIAEQVAQRNAAVRHQNVIAVGLTLFLILLSLVFAVVVMRQLRALQARRVHLEALAVSLQEARIDAEQASRAKSAFLANMSHELRTPFNGLLGMLSLLQRSRLDAAQTDYLQTARESGEHLLGILNDVLDISKLESGRLEIDPEPFALQRLLGDLRSVVAPQAQAKRLAWRIELADELPPWIRADARRLKQILFNLVGNALKFTEQGEIVLRVDRLGADARQGRHQDQLRLRVRDTGIGMDRATLARLFQRFSQGDQTINRRYGGTGLGLEISRTLARMMGGDILVDSRPGEGSEFTVLLPLEPVAPPAHEGVEPSSPAPLEAAGPGSVPALEPAEAGEAGEPLEVLVTDDHPVNRKFIQALLAQMGHRSRVACDGAEAVQALRERRYDLVLMDIHMPVLDGLAATRAIRALDGPAARTPIVALTADVYTDARERVFEAGMDDFLAKPVQVEQVEALLRRRFGARALRPEAGAPAAEQGATVPPAAAPAAPAAPAVPRRRFRPGDAARVLDFGAIGEVCVAVSMSGYTSLLDGFLGDESGSHAELQAALRGPAPAAQRRAAAHKFKGAAASLGLRELAALALAIESGARAEEEAPGEGAAGDGTNGDGTAGRGAAVESAAPSSPAEQAEALAVAFETARALCARMGWIAG